MASPTVPEYSDHLHLLVYKDVAGREHPISMPEQWAVRRAHILENMQQVMGSLPDLSRRVLLDMQVLATEELPHFTRQKISFAVEENDRVPAYLLIPHDIAGKAPAMLCLHQTTPLGKAEPAGVGGLPNLQYAAHLAERGYVTLAPDYPFGSRFPGYGEYPIDVYAMGYASGTMKGIWNHMRAVDLLQSLPQVDGERIGCIGHSLGGHNTLFVAAFDTRLQVMVSSCGFTAAPNYYGGDLTDWSHSGYMPRIAEVYGASHTQVPFDFPEILAALAPRPMLASAPLHDDNFDVAGVRDCIAAARRVYELFGAEDKLMAIYPDCGHDFPTEARRVAYEWIDRWLKPNQ